MLIYTNQRSAKRKQPKKTKTFLEAQKKHREFLAKHGLTPAKKQVRGSASNFADLSVESRAPEMSNQIPGSGFKRSVDDYKWKKGRAEKPEVIAATEEKKKRLAPAYNKGPVMYITDEADKISLGRKV